MKKRKSFTLVELLVVIAILGILATVAITGYNKYVKSAHISVECSNAQSMNCILICEQIYGNVPEDEADVYVLLSKHGISKIKTSQADLKFVYDTASKRILVIDTDDEVLNNDVLIYGDKEKWIDLDYDGSITSQTNSSSYSDIFNNN